MQRGCNAARAEAEAPVESQPCPCFPDRRTTSFPCPPRLSRRCTTHCIVCLPRLPVLAQVACLEFRRQSGKRASLNAPAKCRRTIIQLMPQKKAQIESSQAHSSPAGFDEAHEAFGPTFGMKARKNLDCEPQGYAGPDPALGSRGQKQRPRDGHAKTNEPTRRNSSSKQENTCCPRVGFKLLLAHSLVYEPCHCVQYCKLHTSLSALCRLMYTYAPGLHLLHSTTLEPGSFAPHK